MEEVYTLENVTCRYGATPALMDVNLTIYSGQTVAIIGANGSGKSTLLKILDALVFPDRGSIKFFGAAITKGFNSTSFRKLVGFVFHEPDVQLFSATVYEEVSFGPLQLGLDENEVNSRVTDTLDMLGLDSLKDRPPYSLSSGEKKKVAIASVLSINPEVLILDEPTTGLDPRTQVWLIELILELKKLKKTAIVATHDLSLACDISDRTIVLDESHRIAADGPTPDILNNKGLLLKANLIHEHAHRHGDLIHTHSHGPYSIHDEHE